MMLGEKEDFRKSDLFQTFDKNPLGFIDVGSLDWIHPMSLRVASVVHALCFELDAVECDKLREKYSKDSPYHKVTVVQRALDEQASKNTKLNICKHAPNTSLLAPHPAFMQRYKAERFVVDRVAEIETQPLDALLFDGGPIRDPHMGEFIKIDTQGAEYRIFQGAKRTLAERCLGVFCEVEFFEVYQGQKTYADIDLLLREYGLCLYGFYPHYRSTKQLDVRKYAGEERLMWADAVFIKDPFDPRNAGRKFSERDFKALILIGIMCRFYDFALEIVHHLYGSGPQTELLTGLIQAEALVDQRETLDKVTGLYESCRRDPENAHTYASHFVSRNRTNSSNDYLFPKTLEEG